MVKKKYRASNTTIEWGGNSVIASKLQSHDEQIARILEETKNTNLLMTTGFLILLLTVFGIIIETTIQKTQSYNALLYKIYEIEN